MGTRLKEKFINRKTAEDLVDRGVEKFMNLGLEALQVGAEKMRNAPKRHKMKSALKNMRERIQNADQKKLGKENLKNNKNKNKNKNKNDKK